MVLSSMPIDLTILYILLLLLAGLTTGKNSCRQCIGAQRITFETHISLDLATTFFKRSIGNCATGGELEIHRVEKYDCRAPCISEMPNGDCGVSGPSICTEYNFKIRVWRYCGNGGSLVLNKGTHCIDNECARTDDLGLTCYLSVGCKGKCDCKNCKC